jgi:hypothetical protein
MAHRRAIAEPDSLADVCIIRGIVADHECEDVLSVAKAPYEEKTGVDLRPYSKLPVLPSLGAWPLYWLGGDLAFELLGLFNDVGNMPNLIEFGQFGSQALDLDDAARLLLFDDFLQRDYLGYHLALIDQGVDRQTDRGEDDQAKDRVKHGDTPAYRGGVGARTG